MIRQTHTYATLAISPAAWQEIRDKLAAVGYEHAFIDSGPDKLIDMHGIALEAEKPPAPAVLAYQPHGCSFHTCTVPDACRKSPGGCLHPAKP